MREYLETALAPRIQGDGGWVEYAGQEGEEVRLIFRGECSKCHILDRCIVWMEQEIQAHTGETVKIVPIRKKPFFWDNN